VDGDLVAGVPTDEGVLADELAHFRSFGFVVLRRAVDPELLSDEVDRALHDSSRGSFAAEEGGGTITGRYVPMMCERTPVSLQLLDRFAALAARFLDGPVLPVRAKGILYDGPTNWHRDTDRDVASMGFAAYLEPLDADTGALRVLPCSHLPGVGAVLERRAAAAPGGPWPVREARIRSWPGYVVSTVPGDVIVLDEHLFHASAGGRDRRQWRVDFVADPVGPEAQARVRDYYAATYQPDWDGGYDVDRFPTYGPDWLGTGRPWLARLDEMGAHAASHLEEANTRRRQAARVAAGGAVAAGPRP
jgi:hypothetical protein